MEHDVRAEHVRHVGQGPRSLLGNAGDNVVKYFEGGNEDYVDSPSSFCTCPIGVQVGQNSLITDLFEGLGGLMIDL